MLKFAGAQKLVRLSPFLSPTTSFFQFRVAQITYYGDLFDYTLWLFVRLHMILQFYFWFVWVFRANSRHSLTQSVQ